MKDDSRAGSKETVKVVEAVGTIVTMGVWETWELN